MENISKKKRGRPITVFADEDHRKQAKLLWNVNGSRTLANRTYYTRAMQAMDFGNAPEFLYLADAKANRYRMVLLTELGRFDDHETIRRLAKEICDKKMKTADAVARLRAIRKTAKRPTEKDLRRKLARCVDDWMLREGATFDVAVRALQNVLKAVEGLATED